MPSTTPVPTVSDVDRIAALPDPVIRNLAITQCYTELSSALAQRTGPAANWCTFATWASKQAGQTIRQEDLIRTLEYKLKYGPAAAPAPGGAAPQPAAAVVVSAQQMGAPEDADAIEETLWQVLDPRTPFNHASDAVARGNRKVFAEIGREFARFLATCTADAAFDQTHIDAFCQTLRPGDPPDGQRLLRDAFTRYYRALFVEDAGRRAQWLLLANIEIGLHEQTRLQPEIRAALDAPIIDPRDLSRRLVAALFPRRAWLTRAQAWWQRLRGRPSLLDKAVDLFVDQVREDARLIVSEQLMTISLPPDVRIRLGHDLRAQFPASLRQITDPNLLALLELVDPTPDSQRGSGAADWSNLPDRLHFIADLFRCYQEDAALLDPPFTAEQVAALKAGRKPGGRL
jgi:hypothetical protein